ncbi:probable glutathione S-transferase 6 [Strongylocentrotus purpuratus]|uniref:Glutathione transferase n=1 Tax=Strongylocentrotus purpuratus TaxID=7668 RepID=A0A7M7NG47_STRPU|nr:probable glutathione S-transferase 6 [Strongylocentrotus purpuratus]
MPTYKLMYFNVRGRAEATRMIFALAGQDYEDYRFKEGEWPEIKGNTELFPLGQCPVLLIDGKAMPHSKAINQHLAREFGLYGANSAEAAQIDIVGETVIDIVAKILPVAYEKDEKKKKELLDDFMDKSSKPFLPYLNNLIETAGGRFFVGNSETLVDIVVYCLLDFIFPMVESAKETYPALAKFYQSLTDNSRLTDYLKNRPPVSK